MASRLFARPLAPFVFTSTLCATSILASPFILQTFHRPILCDSTSQPLQSTLSDYKTNTQTPIVRDGRWSPSALKQISTGSILGLAGGLAVSIFSKPLALLIGLLVFGVQFLESRGLHIIPYQRIQGYFKSVNIRSAVQDNVAFKLSFGATFALAGFAHF